MENTTIAICIPTYNRCEIIEELFKNRLMLYKSFHIDVYVYDSSESDETMRITKEWMKENDNLYYVHIPAEVASNMKVYMIYQRYGLEKEYDFIWVCSDAIRWSRRAVETLLQTLNTDYDIITLNYRDEEHIGTKEYTNPQEFFVDCAWHLTLYGAAVVNTKKMLDNVDWEYMMEKYNRPDRQNFSHVGLYFEQICTKECFKAIHISVSTVDLIPSLLKKYSGWRDETFRVWCDYWPSAIYALPDYYKEKDKAIQKSGLYAGILDLKALVELRSKNMFDRNVYSQYKTRWKKLMGKNRLFVKWIAMMDVNRANDFVQRNQRKSLRKEMSKAIRFSKKYDDIYIYGAGKMAKRYAEFFEEKKVTYKGFVVTNISENKREFMGHPVIELQETEALENLSDIGFIIALNQINYEEVIPEIRKRGIVHNIYRPYK